MNTNLQNAQKGDAAAMTALWDATKETAWGLAASLLKSEREAAKMLELVYQDAWKKLMEGYFLSEEAFSEYVEEQVVRLCRLHAARKNPKAFRVSSKRSFLLDFAAQDSQGTSPADFLDSVPILQRFLYCLHALGYSTETISRLFDLHPDTVDKVLDSLPINVKRFAQANRCELSAEQVSSYAGDTSHLPALPDEAEAKLCADREAVAAPVAAKVKKKKQLFWGVLIAAAAVALSVLIGVLSCVGCGSDADAVSYTATIEVQDYGTITVALDAEAAPKTVENFVNLANEGFYDGLTFHRIIEGFMIQGGDPNGDGTGGSDTTIEGEFSDNGVENNLSHTRGAISMARSSDYDSASSQFFIVQEDSTSLDGQYAVFGYVTDGMEVVDAIAEAANPTDDNGTISADEQPVIASITISE